MKIGRHGSLVDEIQGGRCGIPTVMLCVVAIDHSTIPLNVATDADGVNECVVKVRGKEWGTKNPAAVAIAKTLRVEAVEGGD